MKILYALQGTGNGHIARARDLVPLLAQNHPVEVLVSGCHVELNLDYPIKYRLGGLGFRFGQNGGIDAWATWKQASLRRFWKEVKDLAVHDYDLVISDFEPVSAWACRRARKPCVGLSHQAAVVSKQAPKPSQKDWIGRFILNHYAPVAVQYGFHFQAYDQNIFTPIIRQQVRAQKSASGDYYTVYLPAYGDEQIFQVLSVLKLVQWRVFSKHSKVAFTRANVSFVPLNNDAFVEHLAGCKGVLCGAGFETPAEALHLQKKLLVIPMKNQYEQHCNATALQKMGVPVVKALELQYVPQISRWLTTGHKPIVHYPDQTEAIVEQLLRHGLAFLPQNEVPTPNTTIRFPEAAFLPDY